MSRLFSSKEEAYTHVIKVKMPMLDDDGTTTGVVEKWYKKEGEVGPRCAPGSFDTRYSIREIAAQVT